MRNRLHFISGLPRSGSTLLAALLRQNPRFSAGMSSPVYALFRSMLQETSARNEGSVFIDDAIRKRLLTGVFDAYYAEATPETVIFDTNRGWTTKLPALVELFPDAKMICCVRNPAWILDSVESLIRRNAFELSGIFSYEFRRHGLFASRGSRVGRRDVRLRLQCAARGGLWRAV